MSKKPKQVIQLEDRSLIYRINHENIIKTIESFIDQNHFPTVSEIANETHLSRQTVHSHIRHIKYFNLDADDSHMINVKRQRLLELLYDYAVGHWPLPATPTSTLKAIDMYLKWTDPKEKIEPLQSLTLISEEEKQRILD